MLAAQDVSQRCKELGITALHIKLRATGGNRRNKTRAIIIVVITSIVSIVLLVLSVWICFKLKKPRKNVETFTDEMSKVESLQYDFTTIQTATNNFCDESKLGQGGFGAVYKGELANGLEVAVKRLCSGFGQGNVQFKNELLLVAKLQHRNLVRLLGFFLNGDERLLIYEYVPNTSLDHFIFDPIKRLELNWEGVTKSLEALLMASFTFMRTLLFELFIVTSKQVTFY